MPASRSLLPGKPRKRVQAQFLDGRIFEAPPGTPLAEIMRAAARAQRERSETQSKEPLVVAAILNNRLHELTTRLTSDVVVHPISLTDKDGMRIYRRSLVFLLVRAAADVYPEAEIFVSHSTYTGGYYCEVRGRAPLQQAELQQIETRMREIVVEEAPFLKASVPVEQAIEIFRARGEDDKARLLAHRRKEMLPLYTLLGRQDYFQGYMVPATGYLQVFGLQAFPPGFVLQSPRQDSPTELPTIAPYPKLFTVFREYAEWLDLLGIRSVGALNEAIAAHRLQEISLVVEAFHESRLARIATEIAARREAIKIVLVAGPSSAGKTTFSKRLAVELLAHGLRPFPLSLDDYFVDRELTPRDASGQLDYESFLALDVALFEDQLLALTTGQSVQLPRYNFLTGRREPGPTVHLGPDNILIVEGIHGLNPALIPNLPPERVYRVYVSALTQFNLDRHNRVSTTDSRLIRRLVRDAATRGYTAADTLQRWEAVKRGEKQNIFPYQENCDAVFNSALVHELAVLRPLAEPLLLQVRPEMPGYLEANRLLSFLQWFRPASPDPIPDNSILREFVGGSILENFRMWPD
jgi:uridine kinase